MVDLDNSRYMTKEEDKTLLAEANRDPHFVEAILNSLLRRRPRTSLFAPHLLKRAHPYDFRCLSFQKYDSSKIDPVDHIMAFDNKLLLQKSDDANCDNLFCRLFPGTFNREALNWLVELSSGGIYSWDEFITMFASRFSYNYPKRKIMQSLFLLWQSNGEELVSY